jgi:hypothetical protein
VLVGHDVVTVGRCRCCGHGCRLKVTCGTPGFQGDNSGHLLKGGGHTGHAVC